MNTAINGDMVSKSGAALSPSPQRSSGGAHVIQLPGVEADLALVRSYSRELKIACDELHDDPFNAGARAALLKLIVDDSSEADAALTRALAENGAGIMGD